MGGSGRVRAMDRAVGICGVTGIHCVERGRWINMWGDGEDANARDRYGHGYGYINRDAQPCMWMDMGTDIWTVRGR